MFAAVLLPEDVSADLDRFTAPRREYDESSPEGRTLRWALPEQWHVTLAFLPAVADGRRDELSERLAHAARRRPRFTLRVAGAGAFPDPSRAKVLWAGLAGYPNTGPLSGPSTEPDNGADAGPDALETLRRLATGARSAAAKSGVEVAGGRFRPHLTLARLGRPADLTRWLRVFDGYRGPAWTVDEIALVESHLGQGPGGHPRYDVAETFPLGQPSG